MCVHDMCVLSDRSIVTHNTASVHSPTVYTHSSPPRQEIVVAAFTRPDACRPMARAATCICVCIYTCDSQHHTRTSNNTNIPQPSHTNTSILRSRPPSNTSTTRLTCAYVSSFSPLCHCRRRYNAAIRRFSSSSIPSPCPSSCFPCSSPSTMGAIAPYK